jgi:hypothetical protein
VQKGVIKRIFLASAVLIAVMLWVRSYFAADGVYALGPATYTLHSVGGQLIAQRNEWRPNTYSVGFASHDIRDALYTPFQYGGPYWGTFGFDWDYELIEPSGEVIRPIWILGIPWWFITSICVVICGFAWKGHLRRKRGGGFPVQAASVA